MDLNSEIYENNDIVFSVSEPMQMSEKEKSWKVMIIL